MQGTQHTKQLLLRCDVFGDDICQDEYRSKFRTGCTSVRDLIYRVTAAPDTYIVLVSTMNLPIQSIDLFHPKVTCSAIVSELYTEWLSICAGPERFN